MKGRRPARQMFQLIGLQFEISCDKSGKVVSANAIRKALGARAYLQVLGHLTGHRRAQESLDELAHQLPAVGRDDRGSVLDLQNNKADLACNLTFLVFVGKHPLECARIHVIFF
jgi:hypothetical protein